MKYIYIEKVVLTKEEVAILNKANKILENIYNEAKKDSYIEKLTEVALENICDLLSDDYSEME